jgi:hypothetical protein
MTGFPDHKNLLRRAMDAFDDTWPRLASDTGKLKKIILPLDPDNPKGRKLTISIRPTPFFGATSGHARPSNDAYGNYVCAIHRYPGMDPSELRQAIAHETTHVSQFLEYGAALDHVEVSRLYRLWIDQGGQEMDWQPFYRLHVHGDLPTEQEANAVALLELIRVGDMRAALDMISGCGPYIRLTVDQFESWADQMEVPEDHREGFAHALTAWTSFWITEAPTAEIPGQAAIQLRNLAHPLQAIGGDGTAAMLAGLNALHAYAPKLTPENAPRMAKFVADYAMEVEAFHDMGRLPPFWLSRLTSGMASLVPTAAWKQFESDFPDVLQLSATPVKFGRR